MSSPRHIMSEFEAIPQMDLAAQYAAIGDEIREAVTRVMASQRFVLGNEGAALESEIAELCGVTHGVGVASGTDALILALRSVGVAAGDEVILPPFTFVATGSAVSALGAGPVFADIEPDSFNISAAEIAKRITPRTRAIIVVHLYGLSADMDAIRDAAKGSAIPIVEDNAQAIGATYKGKPTGALGDVACISFYPTKNLGAYGDAGMIVTNSAEMDTRLRTLRNHGQSSRYSSVEPGWNSRLDEIQAAVLRAKLRYLREWERARRSLAAMYSKILAPVESVRTPQIPAGYEHVFHQYTIRVPRRDELQKFLSERNIGSAVYYPVPLHLQPIYAKLAHPKGTFPHAERAAEEAVSLPMFPELRPEQVQRVAETIAEFYSR
ncbi:MAG TPA: DegT/DnrJ/EryC1/StrS family aminotransferase [Candidatus Acidoferrum sp.]|nr:DegT/DnrJ/EryC1/StrS family aminotransferase [Candidatus Acidoferrum sp.]